MNMTERQPYAPGEILVEEFLEPLGLSQTEFARQIGVSRQRMNEICTGKRAIIPDTSVRLARALGTTPEFWMNLQMKLDLWKTLHDEKRAPEYRAIRRVDAA